MKIAVLGSGSWGTTLANHLCKKAYSVVLYARDAAVCSSMQNEKRARFMPDIPLCEKLCATSNPIEAVQGADVVVLAVPSQSMRSLLMPLAVHIPKDAVMINVSKGIEVGTLLRMEQVVSQILPEQRYATLSGPTHAEEVIREMPSVIVASARDRNTALFVQDLFMNEVLRVYTNPDLCGVELGGALKNVLALGIGILDGMGAGDNTRAAMLTRGLYEMTKIGIALGAKQATFSGLTGMGDLIVTATSVHSRNHRAGLLLGQGKTLEETLKEVGMEVEGVMTTKSARALAQKLHIELPITNEIGQLLFEQKPVMACIADLMSRERRLEMEPLLDMPEYEG